VTSDIGLLRECIPCFSGIVDAYLRGTRYNIHVELCRRIALCGGAGVQLTWWMRKLAIGSSRAHWKTGRGKCAVAQCHNHHGSDGPRDGRTGNHYEELADRARTRLARFWNPAAQFCFDVIDGPGGAGATMRRCAQSNLRRFAAGDRLRRRNSGPWLTCARANFSPPSASAASGLESRYRGGTRASRKSATPPIIKGRVGWLLGPFALAHLRVYQDLT